MAGSPIIRRSSAVPPPIPPPRGAPGNAGARVAGQLSEEVAERLVKDFLAKQPGGLAGKVVDYLVGKDELAVKAVGFSLSEVTREAIFSALQRLGINTEAGLVRAFADMPDNIIRGVVEAFAETAQGRSRAPAQQTASSAPAQPAAGGTVVLVVTSFVVDTFVHRADPGNPERVFCRTFFEAKAAWEKARQGQPAPRNDQQQGGGRGKGRDNRPQHHQPPAGKFPQETLTLDQAKQTGLDECPVCKPYTAAGLAAQEAAMADTSTAAAPAAEASKPIEGWDEKVGRVGRWLARALDASVENADSVDDKKIVPVIAWADFALVLAHELLVSYPDPQLRSGFENGKMKPLTTEQIFALPSRLNDEQVERTVRFIFGQGAGKLTKPTQLKNLLDTLTGQKKKVEEEKKAAAEKAAKEQALRDAQAKLAAAGNPVETERAKAEIAKAEKALEPPPPPPKNPWPRRLIIGGAVTFGLLVIVTLVGVAVAMTL